MVQVIHNVVMLSSRPPGSLISPNTRIKSLERNMAEVQLTLSSMIQSSSPRSVEKLKIRITERAGSKAQTPVKVKADMDRLKASRVSVDGSESQRIGKLKITPERLKDRRHSSSQDYVSEMNTPTSLKIRKPSGSPERPLSKTKPHNSQSVKKSSKPDHPGAVKKTKAKKFSIFKTRNKDGRDENAVNFTDKTVGKKLSIRRSSKDPEVSNGAEAESSRSCRSALRIEIDDEEDMEELADEFTQAAARPLASPQSKMPVVQQGVSQEAARGSGGQEAAPVRRNIFGPHSPACRDEISPEKKEKGEVRPASRTQGRVLSNEDAIKAIDAVVTLSEIQRPVASSPAPPPPATPTPTPSLPMLSPHETEVGENILSKL